MNQQRKLGPFTVSAIGLGCMNLSHACGVPPAADAAADSLLRALDLGVTHFDTAARYGFGANEELVGRTLGPHRSRFTLASKCGIYGVKSETGMRRVIDGRPSTHRWDKSVAVEESIGALSDLAREGKIRAVGLSEVSAATLRRAHAVHPIAAVQSEYSLCTRNPEIAVIEACRSIGATFVAFSPLARGQHVVAIPGTTCHPPGGESGRRRSRAAAGLDREAGRPHQSTYDRRQALQRRHAGRGRHREFPYSVSSSTARCA